MVTAKFQHVRAGDKLVDSKGDVWVVNRSIDDRGGGWFFFAYKQGDHSVSASFDEHGHQRWENNFQIVDRAK